MRSATELKQIFLEGWNVSDRVSNYVRAVTQFTEGNYSAEWRKGLEEILAAREKLTILDAGTGPGVFACVYAQMGHESVGLDFSESMIEVAKQRAARLHLGCSFVRGDVEEPPFPNDTFDVVSSRHVLFNVPRPGVAVREWTRILKPGGKIIIIGNEHGQPPSFCQRAKHLLGRGLLAATRRPSGWKPPSGYLQAVSECPLFHRNVGATQAIMEAAGLRNILSHPADEMHTSWMNCFPLATRWILCMGRPFILTGVKP